MAVVSSSEKIAFIRSLFGQVYIGRDGKNVAIKCPACVVRNASKATSTKKKLIIRLDDDAAHCWVCGWSSRSLAPLIVKFCDRRYLEEYKEKFGFSGHVGVSDDSHQSHVVELPKDFKLLSLASNFDPDVKAVRRYLESRNIDNHDLWYYRIGVSDEPRWRRRVLIPSFSSSGKLNYFVGRATAKTVVPKYDNVDIPKTEIVFNEMNVTWNKRLVVCEGPFDAFKCGDNATCLLGSELNEGHVLFDRIIENLTPVVLSLDSDMKDKTDRIARKLSEYDVDVKIVDLMGNHDPGSMTKSQFKEALESSHSWSWNSSFKDRLQAVMARL